jgi:predicted DNA-binding transcriptional regulator AlpA
MNSPFELLDRREVCRVCGGINSATLYRGIRDGRFPKPCKIGSLSRWLRSECEAALVRMMEARNV